MEARLLRYRSRKKVSLGTLFGLLSIALYLSYNAGFFSAIERAPSLEPEPQNAEQWKKENEHLKQKLVTSERNYQILLETKKNLEKHLKALQLHNSELTRDMAVYQTLQPTPIRQEIQIKSFKIFSTPQAHTFRYLLILGQSSFRHQAEGALMMTIVGKIDEKAVYLPVKYIDAQRPEGLGFKFHHLQELSGELTLPDQFVPESVLLRIRPDKSGQPFQQEFPWICE